MGEAAASRRQLRLLLLAPSVMLIAVGVVLPLAATFVFAFRFNGAWTLRNFWIVLTQAPYVSILLSTLWTAVIVCLLSVGLAFPVCAYFASLGRLSTNVFIASMSIVLAISMLVRTYAWQVLLAYNGPVNDIALAVGLVGERQRMLFTRPAVILAMVQFMTPYAALILFSAMQRIDRDLVTAARTLGCNFWAAFRTAYWPQVSSSVLMATILVFAMSTGFFVAPALLGGPGEAMVGTQIHADLIFNHRNGAGLATAQGVILAVILALVSLTAFRIGGGGFLKTVVREGGR